MWRVLVVDDDRTTRNLIVSLLRNEAVCVEAINGIDALQLFTQSLSEKKPFDVILLDILLPDVYGLEVSYLIRKREKAERIPPQDRIPIVMLTANAYLFRRHLENCSTTFIEKPITASKLITAIRSMVKAKEIQ